MSTTLNNILGVSGKPTAPYTPPGIDSSLPGAAGTQPRQSTTDTLTAKPEAPTPQEVAPQTTPPEQRKANPSVEENHGKVLREFGDGIHAFMEDGTIRTRGFAGYTYSNPEEVRMSNVDLFRIFNPYKPPTPEELEKERKKQRREQIFAAIGDGISALSNLFFTTQYAPNMYRPAETQSEKTRKRWDKLTAERNANMTAYLNGLMRALQADYAYNRSERDWERQNVLDKIKQESDAAADERAEAEEERKKELHPYAMRKAESDAQIAEEQAKYAEEYEQSRIGRNKAAAGASNASAGASRARARYYDRGGSGGSKSKYMQEAYDYWMSLTDEQKKQYRDGNNRYRKVKTGTDDYDNPIFTNQYMDDDDDFIQMVWEQRQGWLKSHGSNGKKLINGFGSDNSGKKKIEGFGS